MGIFLWLFYGFFAFVALSNRVFMRRPGRRQVGQKILVLIPARDEEENLKKLLPVLAKQAPVIVFDDDSSDQTAAVAFEHGATVLRSDEKLQKGWTGKNRACHLLGQAALATDAEWFLFIDADVQTKPDFIEAVRWLCCQTRKRPDGDESTKGPVGVITGFPKVIPGQGIEPLFLGWVGWILLATNPFGLVSVTGKGHNRFTNGQFHCWRRDVYAKLQPNEAVRHHVLEDVMMGRLLAKHGIQAEVANMSGVLSVHMYDTWRQTLDGMSKNSYEIMGSAIGSYGVSLLLFTIAWLWVLHPWAYLAFVVSGLAVASTVRAPRVGYFLVPFTMPIVLTIGAYTLIRSVAWRRRGTVVWKGRTYTS